MFWWALIKSPWPADCENCVKMFRSVCLRYCAAVLRLWITPVIVFFDVLQKLKKDVVDRLVLLSRCFEECRLPGFRQAFALLRRHSAFLMQICFVANQHNRHVSFSHHVNQLLVDDFDDFERLLTGDGVNQYVPVEVLKFSMNEKKLSWKYDTHHWILSWKDAVFILTGSVHQLNFIVCNELHETSFVMRKNFNSFTWIVDSRDFAKCCTGKW